MISIRNIGQLYTLKRNDKVTCVTIFVGQVITDLSPLGKTCPNLTTLYVSSGGIEDLQSLRACSKLDTLNIRGHQITHLQLAELKVKLRSLNIQCNLISNIEALRGMDTLVNLIISSNPITSIEPIETMTQLKYLVMHDLNKIENIDALNACTSLESIDARSNIKLQSIVNKTHFSLRLNSLSTINVVGCELTNANFIRECRSLEKVYLSHNRLTNLDFIRDLPMLKYIDISYNAIEDVGAVVNSSIEILVAQNNKIVMIPSLRRNCRIRIIDLENNPISNLDFIRGNASLDEMILLECPIRDVSPLLDTSIKVLILPDHPIGNLHSLLQSTTITQVYNTPKELNSAFIRMRDMNLMNRKLRRMTLSRLSFKILLNHSDS